MQVQVLRKNDPLVKTLTEAKRTYFLTKMLVEETWKEISRRNTNLEKEYEFEVNNLNRESVELYLISKMEIAEKDLKIKEKAELLKQAEKLLIDTGAEIIKRLSANMWSQISIVFETAIKEPYKLGIRKKVIELTLKLDPTK